MQRAGSQVKERPGTWEAEEETDLCRRDSLQRPAHVDWEMLWGYIVLLNTRSSAARRHPGLHCTPKCHCWGSCPGSFSLGHLTTELTHHPTSWLGSEGLKVPLPPQCRSLSSGSKHSEVCVSEPSRPPKATPKLCDLAQISHFEGRAAPRKLLRSPDN